MAEKILVGLIVLAAFVFLVRSLVKAATGKKPACTCVDAQCPLASACSKAEEQKAGVTEKGEA